MKLAGDFLSKFLSLTPPDEAVKTALVKIISTVAGIPVSKKDITISRGVVFVECSSVAKNTLRMRRGEVLSELFVELPKARDVVRDIR